MNQFGFDQKEVEETLVKVALRIAKRGEGALFVVGNVNHEYLIDQSFPPFKVVDNPKLLESLALIDGAVLIGKDGFVKSYGVMIKSNFTFKNFGTRHSAAISASKHKENLVILVSEEDKKVRIFKEGKMVMQIDPLQRNVEQSVPTVVKVLESIGVGAIGTISTGLIAPSLGITMIPGVIIFGSAYYLLKLLSEKLIITSVENGLNAVSPNLNFNAEENEEKEAIELSLKKPAIKQEQKELSHNLREYKCLEDY